MASYHSVSPICCFRSLASSLSSSPMSSSKQAFNPTWSLQEVWMLVWSCWILSFRVYGVLGVSAAGVVSLVGVLLSVLEEGPAPCALMSLSITQGDVLSVLDLGVVALSASLEQPLETVLQALGSSECGSSQASLQVSPPLPFLLALPSVPPSLDWAPRASHYNGLGTFPSANLNFSLAPWSQPWPLTTGPSLP